MRNRKMEQLKAAYHQIPISPELDIVIANALLESEAEDMRRQARRQKTGRRNIMVSAAAAAAVFVALFAGLNTSESVAYAMAGLPVVGGIFKVITIREYKVDKGDYQAEIEVPEITATVTARPTENPAIDSLNAKYLAEAERLYDQFMADKKAMEQSGGGHLGVKSGYVVKTNNKRILSIGRYVVNTVGSSSTTIQYDTVDKQDEVLLSLPGLFKDKRYLPVISDIIKAQMIEQYNADPNKYYWVEGIPQGDGVALFGSIAEDQNFYINADGKLVIAFQKYEVAPGYMGCVEFVIPTEAIDDLLVGHDYVK